jgi:hypothetical protein
MPHDVPDSYSTWLVVPYFAGDQGRAGIERPLLASAVSWLCPALRVNGGPLRTYVPGEPTTVEVTVANYGGGAGKAPVSITVWWADPNAGFATASWFGAANVAVGAKGQSATATITGVIPVAAPSHVCLLASVVAPGDPLPPNGIAPGAERHWAQLNLDAVKVAGTSFTVPFLTGNPTGRRARTHVIARVVGREAVGALAGAVGVEPFQEAAAHFRLAGEEGAAAGDEPLVVDLAPGETRRVELTGTVEPPPPPGTAFFVEVVQHAPAAPGAIVGALGVAVMAEA